MEATHTEYGDEDLNTSNVINKPYISIRIFSISYYLNTSNVINKQIRIIF